MVSDLNDIKRELVAERDALREANAKRKPEPLKNAVAAGPLGKFFRDHGFGKSNVRL